jgi:hypothetical protein
MVHFRGGILCAEERRALRGRADGSEAHKLALAALAALALLALRRRLDEAAPRRLAE